MASHTVYAVASGKGGVGKTATTVNLGASLAEAGYNVAVVDADLGMANLGGFIGVEPDETLHEVLAGDASLEAATYEALNGLAVVPSGISLNGFANVETAALSDAVGALRDAFDYVLLDLGAGLSHDTVLPLALADAVILVSTPQPVSVQDTAKTREITERLGGRVAGVVLTRAGTPADLELDDISETLELPVLAVIPEDESVPESAREGKAVLQHAPESPVVEGYRGLAGIVEEESLEAAPVVPEVPGQSTADGESGREPATNDGPAPDEPATDETPAGEPAAGADDGAPAAPDDGGTGATADAGAVQSADGDAATSADPSGSEPSTADATDPEVPTEDATGAEAPAADAADAAGEGAAFPSGDDPAPSDPSPSSESRDDAETTAAEIAAAIEDAAAPENAAAGDDAATTEDDAAATAAESPPEQEPEPDPTTPPADGSKPEDGPEPSPESRPEPGSADGSDAGVPEESEDPAESADVTDAADDEPEPFQVESTEDSDGEEAEAVDQLFSVEGADPEELEDEDDEEESDGLFGRFLG